MSFRNEPHLELRRAPERAALTEALARLDATLPLRVPVIVGGERRFAGAGGGDARGGTGAGAGEAADARGEAADARGEPLLSIDPGAPARVVAEAAVATPAEVEAAVAAATRAAPAWAATPARERAAVLERAAGELRARRRELAALAVRECAKPWAEADADVCEAVDFLRWYGTEAVRLEQAPPPLLHLPGERNTLRYKPRGVVAVIAPWNFPFAIATGMTAAALATGNAVCLKPAEQSPACALVICEALARAGVPPGALALLPGAGAVGAALAGHAGVHTIAFTGSGAVGLELVRRAAEVAPGQRHLKRTVIEMGGKNCALVAADADLDEVVPELLAAAFGFAGQKCSATARVLVHARVAAPLTTRLRGALETLLVGQAEAFGTDVRPLIEADAVARVERAVAAAAAAGAQVVRSPLPVGAVVGSGPVAEPPSGTGLRGSPEPLAGAGFFAAPALVIDPPPDAAVVREEIFGPVLTVEPVADLDEACARVERLPYALTGGLFTRDPATVARVAARTPVGNLYVNRGTTGAMVGRQPFGGNRLSGTGAKAGGSDYLLQFVEPLVVTENTLRHGLAV